MKDGAEDSNAPDQEKSVEETNQGKNVEEIQLDKSKSAYVKNKNLKYWNPLENDKNKMPEVFDRLYNEPSVVQVREK